MPLPPDSVLAAKLASRRRALLAALRHCSEEEALALREAPQAELLEPPRIAAPYSGGESVRWQRLKLTPKSKGATATGFNLLLASPANRNDSKLPAVVLMHSTGKCKEYLAEHLERWAQRGFIAVAFDAPWHGERALPIAGLKDISLQSLGPSLVDNILESEPQRLPVYHAALVRGWQTGTERYVMDIASDALSVVDYLMFRPDVDTQRIGAVGVSLGGMACWLLAAADERISAAAPAIGVQSFSHSLEKGLWGARVDSIKAPFEAAAKDLGKKEIDAEVVGAVWSRIAPGLAEADPALSRAFDAPLTLPCIAPRPLLVLNGEEDPRCPLEGVRMTIESTHDTYKRMEAPTCLRFFVDKGVGHEMTANMWREIDLFLEAWLSPRRRAAL